MKTPFHLKKEVLQIILLALPFALAAAWWDRIPATIVTHWDLHGRPDGWMPKLPGLLSLPLVNIGLCLLFASIPWLDPRLRRDPASATARYLQTLRWWRYALTTFFTMLAVAVIAIAAGWHIDIGRLACNGAFGLFAVVGNILGRLQPNYFMGIRTPWTLEDATTWRATHRLGGRLMLFGSVTLLAVGLFVSNGVLLGLLFAFLASLGVWSLWYSAWFYRAHGGAHQHAAR